MINCRRSFLPPGEVFLKPQEFWCVHIRVQRFVVPQFLCHCMLTAGALSPCRPGSHPGAGCRRPAFSQRHDGPVPAGPAGQVWPRGPALCPAGWPGCARGGRVPPGQGDRCSAPGLAEGKDLLPWRQAYDTPEHFTPLRKPCVCEASMETKMQLKTCWFSWDV